MGAAGPPCTFNNFTFSVFFKTGKHFGNMKTIGKRTIFVARKIFRCFQMFGMFDNILKFPGILTL